MDKVTDYVPFSEAQALLQSLNDQFESLNNEWAELRHTLRSCTVKPNNDSMSVIEKATILANGEKLPDVDVTGFRDNSDRELEVRGRIESIRKVLKMLPEKVERLRNEAARARMAELEPQFNKVRAMFADATSKLLAAIDAEDALREKILMGGFGFQGPSITNPGWLNREHLLNIRDNL